MTPAPNDGPDDAFTRLLVASDQALRQGDEPSSLAPPELLPRLERGVRCLRLLRQVLTETSIRSPETTPDTIPAPERLGRFVIRGTLGQGASAVVFLAHDPRLRRDVALKVPRPEVLVTPDFRDRFLREARAVARLDHPNIVPVYEAGNVGPVCYIASAYCPGGTLAAWLRQRTEAVPPQVAAELLALLSDAIHFAHERGVVHRDLKPANILLTETRGEGRGAREEGVFPSPLAPRPSSLHPKITDFGLAKSLLGDDQALSRTGAIVGTPSYMAPEQATGRNRNVGPAADVYALGTILYELLAGQPPFRGETPLDTLERVRVAEPVPLRGLRPGLPRDLETVCLRCLEKDPGKRYPSAGELAEDLRRYTRGEPVRARPVGAGERAWKWVRRRPAVAALLATVVLSAVVLLGWGLLYSVQLRAYSQRLSESARDARAQRALALQTLNDLVYNVEEQLRGAPDTQELRRKILLRAVDGLGRILRDSDPSAPDETTVAAHLRLGHVLRELNDVRQARQQFERALAVADASQRADPESLTARLHWGEAHCGLGEADSWLGDVASAREHFQTYLARAEELASVAPDDLRVQACLAEACEDLGDNCLDRGDRREARRCYERAAEVGERLPPRRTLALAYTGLGRVCRELGDLPAARHALERLLEFHERTPHEASSEASARMDRGLAQNLLGAILLELGDAQAGRRHLEQGVALIRQVTDANPRWVQPGRALAQALVRLGLARLDAANLSGARLAFEEALGLRLRLAEADPRNLLQQQDLIDTYGLLGWFEGGTLQPAAARAWYTKALEVLSKLGPAEAVSDKLRLAHLREEMTQLAADGEAVLRETELLRKHMEPAPGHGTAGAVVRANALACAGRPAGAAAVAAALRGAGPQEPERCYAVARCYGLALAAVVFRQEAAGSSSGSLEERQNYASLALASLARAKALGFKDADRLHQEPAFVALRREAGFHDLLNQLRKASP
jgi:tetratricopeptide (TPR) repeat protein